MIFIPNRGEIAQRVAATAQRLGWRTAVAHVPGDETVPNYADLSVEIPSFLDATAVARAADAVKATALHPGYGFLSENAELPKALSRDVRFVGPSAKVLELLADKRAARKFVSEKLGVHVLPSFENRVESVGDEFPVIIKPALGGGGKGMLVARNERELKEKMVSAKRIAEKAFGDGSLLVEKYVENARHVEVQIFGDCCGNVFHVGDRDCSLQRRHQKIIEEAPAPFVDEKTRREMRETAVRIGKAVGYKGAGTVEFLLDMDSGKWYFMEMNARLQVEHPVTEMVSGIDLVECQLDTAVDKPLPGISRQSDIDINGVAIEARVCAEDPFNNFVPSAGKLLHYSHPKSTDDVRIDSGYKEGDDVDIAYDSLIAKVVAKGATREEAVQKLYSALSDFHVCGVKTNIPFLKQMLSHKESPFVQNKVVPTQFLEKNLQKFLPDNQDELFISSALVAAQSKSETPFQRFTPDTVKQTVQWKATSAKKDSAALAEWSNTKPRSFSVRLSSQPKTVHRAFYDTPKADGSFDMELDGVRFPGVRVVGNDVFCRGKHYTLDKMSITSDAWARERHEMLAKAKKASGKGAGRSEIQCPLTAKVTAVNVKNGDKVKKGQVVMVLEAMKMEHIISAPTDGVVCDVGAQVGKLVKQGAVLLAIQ